MKNQHQGEKKIERLKRTPPEIPIFTLYGALSIFLTWPLITRFTTSIYGYYSDNVGTIWILWWLKNAHKFKALFPSASPSFCPLIGAPFGSKLGGYLLEPISLLFERFLLLFTGEVVVYNTMILVSFFLAGITMYYLARYLTGSRKVAFLAGIAYLSCTFHAYNSMLFIRLAQIQWMPLFILALLKFMEKATIKRAFLLFISTLLLVGTCIHYGFFMIPFTIAFLLGRYGHKLLSVRYSHDEKEKISFRVNKRTLAMVLAILFGVVVIIVPLAFHAVWNMYPAGKWPTSPTVGELRTIEYLQWGAASPREYILPSPSNPALGWIRSLIVGKTPSSWYNSLYLGWSLIILSLIGIAFSYKKKKHKEANNNHENPDIAQQVKNSKPGRSRSDVWGFFFASIVCLIFSFSPFVTIGKKRIYLPSILFRVFAPWLRWYQRMAMVVFFGVLILASYGTYVLLNRFGKTAQNVLVSALAIIIIVEMLIVPPFQNFSFKKVPEVYEALEKLPPKSITAFYPMFEPGYFNMNLITFYQKWFKKPMLNGAPGNSDGEALRRVVYNPYNPQVPGILSRFGIKKVVLLSKMFKDYEGHMSEETLIEKLPQEFVKIRSFKSKEDKLFGNATLFDVKARPADFVPVYQGDISVPHMDVGLVTTRVVGRVGIIKILNFKGEAAIDLSIPVTNLAVPHNIRIVINGKLIEKVSLESSQSETIKITNLKTQKGENELLVLVDGPSVPIRIEESNIYGTDTGTITMGDVTIEER